jgi:hypothetical protein
VPENPKTTSDGKPTVVSFSGVVPTPFVVPVPVPISVLAPIVSPILPIPIAPSTTDVGVAYDPDLFSVIALAPLKVNVTEGPANVTLQVSVQDEEAGVSGIWVDVVGSYQISGYCSSPNLQDLRSLTCNISLSFA